MDARKIVNKALIMVTSQEKVSAFTEVVNCEGNSDRSPSCPNCGAWIKHWHALSGETVPAAGDCATLGCEGKTEAGLPAPIVGCHVRIKAAKDQSEYIAPLCQSCNNKKGATLTLGRVTTLVRANVSETCGKFII